MADSGTGDTGTDGEFFDTRDDDTASTETPEPPSHSTRDMGACVEQLTDGLVDLYVPQLHLLEYTLNELVSDQQGLITALERKLHSSTCETLREQLSQTLNRVPLYQQKLAGIERDMRGIDSKVGKLARRAERLREQREKREFDKLEQKRRETERERQLEAKRVAPQHKS